MQWWNELLGQGIKLRKKLFQFPHIVIAHIAPGIQGCSSSSASLSRKTPPPFASAICACLGYCCGFLSLLLIPGLFGSSSNENALSFRVISSKLESFKSTTLIALSVRSSFCQIADSGFRDLDRQTDRTFFVVFFFFFRPFRGSNYRRR